MESISELRAICQKSKVSDREEIGMSYQDFKSKLDLKFSIYFTWIFLRLGISANTVTILSGIAAIIGGILLVSKNIWVVIFGIFFLHLYYLLDYSDGEIARYNNTSSIKGWFLDWYMLFIRDAAMFTGLAIGAYNIESNNFILICGFLAVLIPIMDKTIIGCGWTVIAWTRLVGLQKGINDQQSNDKKKFNKKERSLINNNLLIPKIIKRIWGFLNSIFQHHWSILVLLLLVITQLFINNYLNIRFDFRPYLIIYCGIYGIFYLFLRLLLSIKRDSIQVKYNVLFHNKDKINAKDYFF